MKIIRKMLKRVSMALAGVMLMASGSLAFENSYVDVTNVDSLNDNKQIVEDIFFNDEDCSSCKYVTVYNSDDELVYDALVKDVKDIKDEKLMRLLEKSDYIMSNRITDYYILSK